MRTSHNWSSGWPEIRFSTNSSRGGRDFPTTAWEHGLIKRRQHLAVATVVETVRELLGNVSRFDFQQVGRDLPKVDLPDLEKFFIQTIGRHGADFQARRGAWKSRLPMNGRLEAMRSVKSMRGLSLIATSAGPIGVRVLGVGHLLFDIALEEARNLPSRFARVDGLSTPLLIVTVEDEVTGTGALVHRLTFGVTRRTARWKCFAIGSS